MSSGITPTAAYACTNLASGGEKCARWCRDPTKCIASSILVEAIAAIKHRYTSQGAAAVRGSANPYRIGSNAAIYWQAGHDAAIASQQSAQPVAVPGLLPADWLREDDLLYRADEHGNNHDEIKVAMAGGRRDLDNRAETARLLLALLAASPAPPPPQGDAGKLLNSSRIRGHAVIDGGGYQDDETGEWSFSDDGLQKLALAIAKEYGIGPEQDGGKHD